MFSLSMALFFSSCSHLRTTEFVSEPFIAPAPRLKREPVTSFEGAVTSVDDRSVSIRGFGRRVCNCAEGGGDSTGYYGWAAGPMMSVSFPDRDVACVAVTYTREVMTLISPEGVETVLKRADQPIRKFPVDSFLAAGKQHPENSGGSTYGLSDVRVGDEIYIRLGREKNDGLCWSISIRRRPGGRVPPVPGEGPAGLPFHVLMNAYQDLEEKGTPLPERIRTPIDPELMMRIAKLKPGTPLPYEYHSGGPWPQLAPPPRPVVRETR